MTTDSSIALNYELCRECGGRCCQASPGVWSDPQRFMAIFFSGQQMTLEQLRLALPELKLVLWEKSGIPVPAPLSVLSGCAFHVASGCCLTESERPCQCLALRPRRETVEQTEGCFCYSPENHSWETVKRHWQKYWATIPL